MSQLDDAITRYNKLLENGPCRDLAWVDELHKRMEEEHLSAGGRLICPFLRPNFITRRQYDTLVKTGEVADLRHRSHAAHGARSPSLLARMELLPAEKMLAAIDPGYQVPEVAARLDSHVNNGTLQVVQYNADSPTGAAYTEGLADLFYDSPPVKEFRKRYHLTRVGGKKHLLGALLKAYKQFGGHKKPNIAILEFRPAYQSGQSEYQLFRDFFREEGYAVEIVSPDQLEYRNKVLRNGPFEIDLVYRRISVQEFLMRFDLSHPLVRAYRERTVCVVNSFRSELAHKKAMFGLLTDETLTAKFPTAERKAIHDHVPWTRLVSATQDHLSRRDHRPAGIHHAESREAGAEAERRLQRPAQLLRLGDGRRRLGARAEAGHALALRGAGEGGPGALRVPHGDLRQPGVQRDAGGRASAGVSRQGAELFQLAVHRQRRVLFGGRTGPDLYLG